MFFLMCPKASFENVDVSREIKSMALNLINKYGAKTVLQSPDICSEGRYRNPISSVQKYIVASWNHY